MARVLAAFSLALCLAHPSRGFAKDWVPAVIAPDGNGQVAFTTPSNNVDCLYTPDGGTPVYKPPGGKAELQCDRAAPVYIRFVLGSQGRATKIVNPGEQPCCSDVARLAYGSRWRVPPFTCESSSEGLACRRDDGHGFVVSRTRAEVK